MIVTTSSKIEGRDILETYGLVMGNTIRSKWIGTELETGLRQLLGGELGDFTALLSQAREEAIQKMVKEAKILKANAVVDVSFTTSLVLPTAVEILVYGTAVKTKKQRK